MISKIFFSIVCFLKFILPGHAELCFLNFCVCKREETYFEKVLRLVNDFFIDIGTFFREIYVILTLLVLSTIGIGTFLILLIKIIKWMLHAQDSHQLNKSPVNKNQVALDFVNRSQILNSQSSTFPSPGFASKVPA